MKCNKEYNKELLLVHKLLSEKYEEYLKSNSIKSEYERLRYAHAVQTVGYIANNCNISQKDKKTVKINPDDIIIRGNRGDIQ